MWSASTVKPQLSRASAPTGTPTGRQCPAVTCAASSRHGSSCTRTGHHGTGSILPSSAVGAPMISHGSPSMSRRTSRNTRQVSALFGREGSAGRQSSSSSSSSSASSASATPNARRSHQSREVERSALANEEAVFLIFQLDLDAQLQRCLNMEAYEAAQEARAKRTKVDEAVAAIKQRKAANVDHKGSAAALSVEDYAAEGLRLRTAMARAVEKEDYKEAATLRDLLTQLEKESRKAQALAAEFSGGKDPRLKLGQRIIHKDHGYRGVVVGWDIQCCEDEEWVAANGGPALRKDQPFYHVVVDERDWEYDAYQPPVAYVAEDFCWVPEDGAPPPPSLPSSAYPASTTASDTGGDQAKKGGEQKAATSWVEFFGSEPLKHPYMYILFLGQDGRGDYVPCRQLRDKYSVRRRDVYRPGEEPRE